MLPFPLAWDILGPYIHYVCIKEFDYGLDRESGKWSYDAVNLGQGDLPWTDVVDLLKSKGYDGILSFYGAYDEDMEIKASNIRADLALIRSLFEGR